MRWLLRVIVVLACLWGGYWFIGAQGVDAAARAWLADQSAMGRQAEYSELKVRGFPNRFDLTLTDPNFIDPVSGIGWKAPFLQVFSLTYKPWHLIAAFPPEQTITLPSSTIALHAEKLQASVVAEPAPSLPLDSFAMAGEGLIARAQSDWQISAKKARIATRRDKTRPDMHEIGVDIETLIPRSEAIASLSASELPDVIERLTISGFIGFTAPLDRFTPQTRPQIDRLELNEAKLSWGSMIVTAKGDLRADTAGYADGVLVLRLENWETVLKAAIALNLIDASEAPAWQNAATFLSSQSEGDNAIEVPLGFSAGEMTLGPFPIGPAPRLR